MFSYYRCKAVNFCIICDSLYLIQNPCNFVLIPAANSVTFGNFGTTATTNPGKVLVGSQCLGFPEGHGKKPQKHCSSSCNFFLRNKPSQDSGGTNVCVMPLSATVAAITTVCCSVNLEILKLT